MSRTILLLAASVAPLSWIVPVSAITIDTVPVGNAGNAPDQLSTFNNPDQLLFGAVAYEYRIGKYEVTVAQYTDFLNAVARTDTYSLYNTKMATDLNSAGIARSGSPGGYTYSVIGSPNHPVTHVSWGDAARFSNWLHNGQPGGAQDASTTEDGAYRLNGAVTNAALNATSRNAGAKWFIPTENEWYKAAYHQPAAQGGDSDNYWAYPTRTNNEPNSDQPPGDPIIQTNVANFKRNDSLTNGYNDGFAVTGTIFYSSSQNYLTDAGAYTQSSSFYGTFDQGGNVFEWNEALIFFGAVRGVRGGSFGDDSINLQASYRNIGDNPSVEISTYGFRVATIVPEPNTLALCLFGALGSYFLARKRHHN